MLINILKKTDKVNRQNYFPELDGLRAFAVLFVLIFHFNENGMLKGGFIGVDIFFVISGFLMTRIIDQQYQNNQFSYRRFIEARITRLYPVLLVVMVASIVAGFLIYSPVFYFNEARSGLYALFSSSNWFFAKGSSYWDLGQVENPFLHTWSLGVEQQFYLFWPLILFGTYRIKAFASNHYAKIFFVFILSVISLMYSLWLGKNGEVTLAFFSTFTRCFELFSGGLLYFYQCSFSKTDKQKRSYISAELLCIGSLLGLVLCAYYFNGKNLAYPQLGSVVIVVLTLTCLQSSPYARLSGWILRNKVALIIGLLSYSIYLIHWPVIKFFSYFSQCTEISLCHQILLACAIFGLSYLSYVMVENRFRKISIFSIRRSAVIFWCIVLLLTIAFILIKKSDGEAYRFSNEQVILQDLPKSTKSIHVNEPSNGESHAVLIGDESQPPSAIVVGDSFATQYLIAMDEFFTENKTSVLFYSILGCYFIDDVKIYGNNTVEWHQYCVEATQNFNQLIAQKKLPVIMIQRWFFLMDDQIANNQNQHVSVDFEKVKHALEKIPENAQNKLILLGTPPAYPYNVVEDAKRPTFFRDNQQSPKGLIYQSDEKNVAANIFIEKLASSNNNMVFIDVYNLFCDGSICSPINDEGKIYYFDNSHLSYTGAKMVWKNIGKQILEEINLIDTQNPR